MRQKRLTLSDAVMSRIDREKITMKPKWYFVVGSIASIGGLAAVAITVLFSANVMSFALRTHGPMGEVRLQQMLSDFPWWSPVVAVFGMVIGIRLLKKYDFSYRRNLLAIVLAITAVLICTGIALDLTGWNDSWSGRGNIGRIYRQYDGRGRQWSTGEASESGAEIRRGMRWRQNPE